MYRMRRISVLSAVVLTVILVGMTYAEDTKISIIINNKNGEAIEKGRPK